MELKEHVYKLQITGKANSNAKEHTVEAEVNVTTLFDNKGYMH